MTGRARTWGSTEAERARQYPCDRWLVDPDDVCFRAIDVAAQPAVVFRWLCQLRAAPYSYDWIDNLDDARAGRLFGSIAISYEVVAAPGGSRLVVKLLIRRPAGPFRLLAPLLPAADLFMMRKQLLTLKQLAERPA